MASLRTFQVPFSGFMMCISRVRHAKIARRIICRKQILTGYFIVRSLAHDRKLFTPGPLMVSDRVKRAMLADMGTRHSDFSYIVKYVRSSLLQIAKVSENEYAVILLNGSGTLALEAALRTLLASRKGKFCRQLIVMENGLHGKQIARMCAMCGIEADVIPVCKASLQDKLVSSKEGEISGVLVIHCETSSGLINPIEEFGELVKKCSPESLFFVDAMTSFGAIPIDMKNIDFMVSNSYKCLQGVPGISFIIAKRSEIERHRGEGDSMNLDIIAQYDELERTGQFRFTPPTHVMLAFKEALLEYSEEGGLAGRSARYKKNNETIKGEMSDMGFVQLYKDEENPYGYIVTTYLYPNNPLFVYEEFYNRLSDTGHVICSERTNALNCFRIGNIGNLCAEDMKKLACSIRSVCEDMRIKLPLEESSF